MAETTRISVPKEVGDEITARWGGNDPVTYSVTKGHVQVENANVDRFLSIVDGAKVASDTKSDK